MSPSRKAVAARRNRDTEKGERARSICERLDQVRELKDLDKNARADARSFWLDYEENVIVHPLGEFGVVTISEMKGYPRFDGKEALKRGFLTQSQYDECCSMTE